MADGDQLPIIPLVEVVGNDGTDAPEQYVVPMLNVGVTDADVFTTTVSKISVPQELATVSVSVTDPVAAASKVYVVESAVGLANVPDGAVQR